MKDERACGAEDLSFEEIKEGRTFGFRRTVTDEDVSAFAELSGDFNPLHTDDDFARSTPFKGRIVHGMLLGSLFSRLIGMCCPGRRSLYISQSLEFRAPLEPGSEVAVEGEVVRKQESVRMITVKMTVSRGKDIIVKGEAKVKLLDG